MILSTAARMAFLRWLRFQSASERLRDTLPMSTGPEDFTTMGAATEVLLCLRDVRRNMGARRRRGMRSRSTLQVIQRGGRGGIPTNSK